MTSRPARVAGPGPGESRGRVGNRRGVSYEILRMISSPDTLLPTARLTAARPEFPVPFPGARPAAPAAAPPAPAGEAGEPSAEVLFDPARDAAPARFAARHAVALVTFAPVLALLAAAVGLRVAADIPVGALTRDRVQLLGGPFYAGLYSTLGLLMWAATAAVCLFAASMLRGGGGGGGRARREPRNMFAGAAAVTLLLLADDMLLVHEIVFPRYLGVRDEVMLALLGSAALAFLFRYRRLIVERRCGYMAATMAFFAASLAFDAIVPDGAFGGQYLIEDGFKMLGIAAWSSFWIQRCATELRGRA